MGPADPGSSGRFGPDRRAGVGVGAPPSRTPGPAAESPRPILVGGYELLDELGRGGMGVVYRARDTRLGRIVALKMLSAGGAASPEALHRFRAEAEAVAGVQHPGIVGIHEIGVHGGLPFLALEFCEGGPLSARLAGRPQNPRRSAALVAAVARAVEAAHRAGVVHRDLKPANVLLSRDGTPKVADFGLAKRADSAAGLTKSGAMLGTPAYMAPEQMTDFRRAGPAADVYSLGAILYECLTGRPPFLAENDVHAIYLATTQEPVPIRRLQPGVPVDLETVCLKCLAKEPAGRYAGAGRLADDLERFLRGEPVRARPVGAVGSAVRWARRHPASAALAGLSGLCLAGVIVGSAAFAAQRDRQARDLAAKNAELENARAAAEDARRTAEAALRTAEDARAAAESASAAERTARESAESERRRVGEGLALADRAVSEIFAAVRSNKALFERPELRDLREALLRIAESYSASARGQGTGDAGAATGGAATGGTATGGTATGGADAVVLSRAAEAAFSAARNQTELGRAPEAVAGWRDAVAAYTRLAAAEPGDRRHRVRLALSHLNLGVGLQELGDPAAAEPAFRSSVAVLRRLIAEADASVPAAEVAERKADLITASRNLGLLLAQRGDAAGAMEALGTALKIADAMAAEAPADRNRRRELAVTHSAVGQAGAALGDTKGPETAYREAMRVFAALAAEAPDDPIALHDVALTHNLLGACKGRRGDHEGAAAEFRAALDIKRRFCAARPDVARHRRDLAEARTNLAMCLSRRDPAAADAMHREALADYDRLVADFPGVPDYRRDRACARTNRAADLAEAGDAAAAVRELRASLAELEAVLAAAPQLARTRADISRACFGLAVARLKAARDASAAEAASAAEETVALLRRVGPVALPVVSSDPVFEPLRSRDDFRALLDEWRRPGRP